MSKVAKILLLFHLFSKDQELIQPLVCNHFILIFLLHYLNPQLQNILNNPITPLFPSQSTEGPKCVSDNKTEDDNVCVSFANIQFDPEEENIPDHMLMSSKHFKILNCKLSSLCQFQANAGSRHSVSGIEVDVMLNSQEIRLKSIMDQMD